MPSIALTDLTVRNLKPVPGKRVTYLDKSIKGFGVRVTDTGQKSYVLTYGEDRKRVKLGDVGIVKLADAREKAKDILAQRQLNTASDTPSIAFDCESACKKDPVIGVIGIQTGPRDRWSTVASMFCGSRGLDVGRGDNRKD